MTETTTEPAYKLVDPSFVAGRFPHPSTWTQPLPESLLAHVDAARAEKHRALVERVAHDEQQARRLAAELERARQGDAGAQAVPVREGRPAPESRADAIRELDYRTLLAVSA